MESVGDAKRVQQVRRVDGKGEGSGWAADLEITPETPNETAVRNQRMFVNESCKLLLGRG